MTTRPPVSAWVLNALLAVAPASGSAATPASARTEPPPRLQTVDLGGLFDANLIGMRSTNTGSFAMDVATAMAGLEYPRGSGLTAVFAGGLWLAGKSNDSLKVAIVDYQSEYAPGAIVGGVPDDPSLPAYRVYKLVRSYATPGDRDSALADYVAGAMPYGAPFVYVRGDGTLALLGDQMLWEVHNDGNPLNHASSAGGTAPLGVEVRQTIYGYDSPGALGSTVFVRFEFTNRSPDPISDMYAGFWSDPDLGSFADDLVGCDPARDLGFCYNANDSDAVYGSGPPAVGYDLLRGPITAPRPGQWASSFIEYINGVEPTNATQTYHLLQGLLPDGSPMIDPATQLATRHEYSGDPVAGTGWLDTAPADKRLMLGVGPFAMAPGESRTVWGAIVIARGPDRLSSLGAMRVYDDEVQVFFDAYVAGVDGPGPQPLRLRVWPNPGREFALAFSLARAGHVRGTIHDLAGREVARVVDRELAAGPHLIGWDGRMRSGTAPSGVYWAKLATPDGSTVSKLVRIE